MTEDQGAAPAPAAELTCEVCKQEPAVGAAAVPGMPVTVAYGRACLDANAHPWGLLVANTMCCGGLEHTDEWWRQMVTDTCTHLGKTLEEFTTDVDRALAEEQLALARADAVIGIDDDLDD